MVTNTDTSESLQQLVRGTLIAAIGTIVGILIQFITRVFIARYGMESNYGVFSLAVAVLNIMTIIGCLGMQIGSMRYVAFYSSKGLIDKLQKSLGITLQITTLSVLTVTVLFFFMSQFIALNIFHSNDLELPLKLFIVGIPFFAFINIITAISRGMGDVKPYALIQIALFNLLFFAFLVFIVIFQYAFIDVYYVYLLTLFITLVATVVYFQKTNRVKVQFFTRNDIPLVKEIMRFSLPLMGMAILHISMLYINTIMLGLLDTMDNVGLFNAAYPLANMLIVPLDAMTPIYLPVITGLYANNKMQELRDNYRIFTKWLFALTYPVFIIVFLFAETILTAIFGINYVYGATALRVLSIGFLCSSLLSLGGINIIAFGSSKYIMGAFLIATIVNLLMCYFMIPMLGITGSAIAGTFSLILLNIMYLAKSYQAGKAQPLSWSLLKPVAIATVPAVILKLAFSSTILPINALQIVLILAAFFVLYILGVLITRCFDRKDMAVFSEIEKLSGRRMPFIHRFLEKVMP